VSSLRKLTTDQQVHAEDGRTLKRKGVIASGQLAIGGGPQNLPSILFSSPGRPAPLEARGPGFCVQAKIGNTTSKPGVITMSTP